jgi:hypothetical protein
MNAHEAAMIVTAGLSARGRRLYRRDGSQRRGHRRAALRPQWQHALHFGRHAQRLRLHWPARERRHGAGIITVPATMVRVRRLSPVTVAACGKRGPVPWSGYGAGLGAGAWSFVGVGDWRRACSSTASSVSRRLLRVRHSRVSMARRVRPVCAAISSVVDRRK